VKNVPKIKSAVKRVRTIHKRTLRNASLKSALRTNIRKLERSLVENDRQVTEQNLRNALRVIDKAVTKGILHKNTAARKKSRLTKKYNQQIKQVV
jgi:small subunit ribosomal protein S20